MMSHPAFADPGPRLDAFIKVEGDHTGAEVVQYGVGSIYSFFDARRSDLENAALSSAPSWGTTVSIANWLPWMEMGTAPGVLIHHIRFSKVADISEIPNRDFVGTLTSIFPDAVHAPATFAEDDVNTTGMGWYKKVIDKKLGRAG